MRRRPDSPSSLGALYARHRADGGSLPDWTAPLAAEGSLPADAEDVVRADLPEQVGAASAERREAVARVSSPPALPTRTSARWGVLAAAASLAIGLVGGWVGRGDGSPHDKGGIQEHVGLLYVTDAAGVTERLSPGVGLVRRITTPPGPLQLVWEGHAEAWAWRWDGRTTVGADGMAAPTRLGAAPMAWTVEDATRLVIVTLPGGSSAEAAMQEWGDGTAGPGPVSGASAIVLDVAVSR